MKRAAKEASDKAVVETASTRRVTDWRVETASYSRCTLRDIGRTSAEITKGATTKTLTKRTKHRNLRGTSNSLNIVNLLLQGIPSLNS
jgi:hypothetical protein